jgi:hypothetical protein
MGSMNDLLVLAKLKMKLDEAISKLLTRGSIYEKHRSIYLDMYFIALNTENRHRQHGTVYCITSTFVVQYHAGGGAKKMKEE